jgi:hypothetical protein
LFTFPAASTGPGFSVYIKVKKEAVPRELPVFFFIKPVVPGAFF